MTLQVVNIILAIVIFVLIIKVIHQKKIDTTEYNEFQNKFSDLKARYSEVEKNLDNAQKKYSKIISDYQEATSESQEQLDELFKKQKEKRQKELDEYFNTQWEQNQEQLELKKAAAEKSNEEYINDMRAATQVLKEQNDAIQKNTQEMIDYARNKFEAILEPLKQYEKDKLEKLFYTIQIPEEYREDIDFLLTTVNQKVRHPDIISKLVWSEYIRPYILDTFKRVGIEAKPGIYKITNINSGKAYIGKSTDIKKRLADHFKSAVGIQSIADQAIHHAILNEGIWNWSIEYIIYCDKDKLNELEKYYIDFFKTQEFGYNKSSGG